MRDTPRRTVLDVSLGSGNPKPTIAEVCFCESSASLTALGRTIHIPWTELAAWQAWLATRIEEEAS